MFFPLKLSWTIDQYQLIMQLLGVVIIVIMLVYVGLSSKNAE